MFKHYLNQLKILGRICLMLLILANACVAFFLGTFGVFAVDENPLLVYGGLVATLFIFWLTAIMKTQNGKPIFENLMDQI